MPASRVSTLAVLDTMRDRLRVLEAPQPISSRLLNVLSQVPDPRKRRGLRYPLAGLLAVGVLATAAGMCSFAGFATWAATAPAEVLMRIGLGSRRPSEKTFRRVFALIDALELERRLSMHYAAMAVAADADGGLVAVSIDGKALRGARRMGATASHLVSVLAHRARLVIGQLAVDDKANEIPAVRKLLGLLKGTRLLVTVDAMHTQVATAKLICKKMRSHYLMVVKANQPSTLAEITSQPWARAPFVHVDRTDKPVHARHETRKLTVLTPTRGIGFPYAKQLIQITRERLIVATGEKTIEIVYAICSLPFAEARPAQIARWLRTHWDIEVRREVALVEKNNRLEVALSDG